MVQSCVVVLPFNSFDVRETSFPSTL